MSERLSEAAVERIVRRAIELDIEPEDDTGGLDVAAVVAAAEELGISREAVLESVALERLGVAPDRRAFDPMFGAGSVMAQRRVPGSADEAFDRLDEWLTHGHHLRREERQAGIAVWRRRTDMAAGLQRTVKGFSGGARLGTVASIAGHTAAIDDETSLVRVVVDRSSSRSAHLGTAGALGASGVATTVTFGVLTSPLAFVGIPVAAAGGVAAIRSRRSADMLTSELTTLLDRVADGQTPSRVIRRRRRGRRR